MGRVCVCVIFSFLNSKPVQPPVWVLCSCPRLIIRYTTFGFLSMESSSFVLCVRFLQLHIFCGNEVNIPLRLEIFSPLEQQTFSVCTAVSGFRPLLVHL